MVWNPFDFNGNGRLDFNEALVGGVIAGGIGYGAAESDALLREEELQERHEEELRRERERAESLERELDRLRSEPFSDYLDDELDGYDEFDDEFDDYGYGRENYYEDDYDDDREDDDDYDDYDDEEACDLASERGLGSGYGLRKAAKAKAPEAAHGAAERHTYVAGANFEGRTAVWLSEMASGKVDLTLQREPENPHDPNAIAVLTNGRKAGYIPAKMAMSLAPTMDVGGSVEVVDSSINAKSDNGKTKVNAWLTLEVKESCAAAGKLEPSYPKKELPDDTFYATDDVIAAILGPSDELLGKLRSSRK